MKLYFYSILMMMVGFLILLVSVTGGVRSVALLVALGFTHEQGNWGKVRIRKFISLVLEVTMEEKTQWICPSFPTHCYKYVG